MPARQERDGVVEAAKQVLSVYDAGREDGMQRAKLSQEPEGPRPYKGRYEDLSTIDLLPRWALEQPAPLPEKKLRPPVERDGSTDEPIDPNRAIGRYAHPPNEPPPLLLRGFDDATEITIDPDKLKPVAPRDAADPRPPDRMIDPLPKYPSRGRVIERLRTPQPTDIFQSSSASARSKGRA